MTFVDCDPVPLALEWCRAHPRVLAEIGGPGHISGIREAPFPHLAVSAGTETDVGDMRTSALIGEVNFELWGPPDGTMGPAALRRLAFVIAEAMVEIPEADYVPGAPVVSVVRINRAPSKQDLTNGQRRWSFTAAITMRPATP